MNLSNFLENRKGKILDKILVCGEDKAKFYQPMVEEDKEAGLFLYVIGCEAEGNSELRILINSRNYKEIKSLENIIAGYKQTWAYTGSRTYRNKNLSINFADYITLVFTQREDFTNQAYSDKIRELLEYIAELITIFSSQVSYKGAIPFA